VPAPVDHLIRVAGPDLGSIASELDKLLALAAGRPLSIGDVRAAVAGDEAAGLYDTLGELLGPTPAKGAESIDRLLAEAGPASICWPSLRVRFATSSSPRRMSRDTARARASRPRSENRIGRPIA